MLTVFKRYNPDGLRSPIDEQSKWTNGMRPVPRMNCVEGSIIGRQVFRGFAVFSQRIAALFIIDKYKLLSSQSLTCNDDHIGPGNDGKIELDTRNSRQKITMLVTVQRRRVVHASVSSQELWNSGALFAYSCFYDIGSRYCPRTSRVIRRRS